MAFPCQVCDKTFNRAQDRSRHIRLKKDDLHKEYTEQQQQILVRQLSTTVEAVTAIGTTTVSERVPSHNTLSVELNDVDEETPSSWNMDVDSNSTGVSDDEQSMISSAEVPVVDMEDNDDEVFVETMAAASAALGGIDLDGIPEAFDFLPEPDLELGDEEAAAENSMPTFQNPRRTLIDMDEEQPTYKWHSSGGKVYGIEPTAHARWRALLQTDSGSGPYRPFNSRLDWEIAQWTLKEKISQKSFDRFLIIPEVRSSVLVTQHTLHMYVRSKRNWDYLSQVLALCCRL